MSSRRAAGEGRGGRPTPSPLLRGANRDMCQSATAGGKGVLAPASRGVRGAGTDRRLTCFSWKRRAAAVPGSDRARAGPAPRHPLHKRLPAQAGAPHRCVSKSAGAPPRSLPSSRPARAVLRGVTASARRRGRPARAGETKRGRQAASTRSHPGGSRPRWAPRGSRWQPRRRKAGRHSPGSRALLLPATALLTGYRSPEMHLPVRQRQLLLAEQCPWGRTSAKPWA